ncbi:MAG: phasin family protein [Desulfobacterales bacterium]|jgi:polyhydroxyalkanoate synthesis regulator phasin|nr:phasin family protein [Desulfobacterales bacterium]
MIEQLKKALTTGVGLALKTWTEVEAAGKEMVKKAQLSEKDAGQFLKKLKESYEKTQKKMESQVEHLVKDILKKADIATNDDVKALKREIQTLRKELKAAKAGKASPAKAKPAAKGKPKAKSAA